jgi:hypothetical protein
LSRRSVLRNHPVQHRVFVDRALSDRRRFVGSIGDPMPVSWYGRRLTLDAPAPVEVLRADSAGIPAVP